MSFWTTQEILRRHEELERKGGYLVRGSGPASGRVREAAWHLTLGEQVFVTSSLEETRRILGEREQVVIPPGQFGLLLTAEEIALPKNAIGFISVRTPKKMRGLVNVSGFHVDPGFCGRLVFSIYNAGSNPIVLERGEELFLLWFADLVAADQGEAEPHRGGDDARPFDVQKTRWHQSGISSEDVMNIIGEIASPAALKKQLDELQSAFRTFRAIVVAVAIALLGAYAKVLPGSCGTSDKAQSSVSAGSAGPRIVEAGMGDGGVRPQWSPIPSNVDDGGPGGDR